MSTLGNWTPLRSRLAPIPFKGGLLFDDEILQQADCLGEFEPSHQRPSRSLTRRPGRNSETRQLYSGRKAVSPPGGLEQDHQQDRWVLEINKNVYALLFTAPPPMARGPLESPLPVLPLKREACWTEVQSLFYKGAIEEIPLGERGGGGYYFHYFLATKRTGGFRPILNLRGQNAYLLVEKFRMETLICSRACG